jgi:hypothetical protein
LQFSGGTSVSILKIDSRHQENAQNTLSTTEHFLLEAISYCAILSQFSLRHMLCPLDRPNLCLLFAGLAEADTSNASLAAKLGK